MASAAFPLPTEEQLKDVDYMPPITEAVPLGIQHVLAMFVGNVTVPLIIAGAIDLPADQRVFLVQAAMFVAGVATLVQSLGVGPIGARLPIVMGTSFGFVPVMIPVATTFGLPAVLGAALVGGIAMFAVGFFLRYIRFLFPPVVTGTFVVMIGLILLPVGFAYAGGGFGAPDFGAAHHLGLAFLVFVVTLGLHQYAKGFLSEIAVLIAIVVGYVVAIPLGLVDFAKIGAAGWVQVPEPFVIGFEFVPAAVLGITLMAIVTCAESIGDIAGTRSAAPTGSRPTASSRAGSWPTASRAASPRSSTPSPRSASARTSAWWRSPGSRAATWSRSAASSW